MIRARLSCHGGDCRGKLAIRAGKRKLAGGSYSIPAGRTNRLTLRLTKAGRRTVAAHRRAGDGSLPVQVRLEGKALSRRLRLLHR